MSPNQVDEMFRLLTGVVGSVQRLEQGQSEIRQDITELRHGQNELRLGQDAQGRKLDEFIDETRNNFSDVKRELRSVNRRVDLQNRDILQVRETHDEILERIEALEEKEAA
jgi:chromosome segregation ATPase